MTLNRKIIAASVLVLAVASIAGYSFLRSSPAPFASSTPFPPNDFPINDPRAQYYIEDFGGGGPLMLTYVKDKRRRSIYIASDHSEAHSWIANLAIESWDKAIREKYGKYVGSQVTVNGSFVSLEESVTCVRAPCPPMMSTRLKIDKIQVVKER